MELTESIARKRQTAKQRDFLTHFSRLGNVRDSAKLAGVSRALVYWWREHSPSFAEKLSAVADEVFGESERKPTQRIPTSAQTGPVRKRERMMP